MAVATEQEMKAKVQEMRAKVVEAEQSSKAMAAALREGKIELWIITICKT